jgi:hypothetical protein
MLNTTLVKDNFSLEDFMANPPDRMEYLESGGEEVWLVFPESRWVMVITENQGLMFTSGQVVSMQKVLKGFSVSVDDLLA